ncbi:MAG: DUF1513 domain-containing protein [Rhodocyclaceae bacterium]|jgi:hypothetical protein|nr:DUF1513 domain-containing protein [Rhodocyclaceae bacterium]
MLGRRRFLGLGAGAALGSLASAALPPRAFGATTAAPRPDVAGHSYLSARADARGQYHATRFDLHGRVMLDHPLPGRGHGSALHPEGHEAVMFSRRPGTFLMVFDLQANRPRLQLPAAPGRIFNGHGVFAGTLLYATESVTHASASTTADNAPAFQTAHVRQGVEAPGLAVGDGVIGVYDPRAGYRRIGEFPSHGLDPHDIRAMRSGALVVANGGLLNHPDAPRLKLNVDSMAPTLVYLDAATGRLLGQYALAPEHHQLSIRHLAIGEHDSVVVAMQYEGPSTDRPPLIALHAPASATLTLPELPDAVLAGLRNYCGSAAVDTSGRIAGISSPRGGRTVFIDLADGRWLGECPLADGCGIAAGPEAGSFILSSGLGTVLLARPDGPPQRLSGPPPMELSHWDNHLTLIA